MLTEVLLSVVIFVFVFAFLNAKPKNLPPGHWGWPVIGKLPSMEVSLSDQVVALSKKYGKIASWRMGSHISIFLSDYKIIKNAFGKPEFSDRPGLFSLAIFTDFNEAGVVFSNGQLWQNNRRFTLRHLRDLGMGKTRLEEAIQYEASCLVKDFEKRAGKPGPLPWSINVAVLNVIWQMIASTRYEVQDAEIQHFNQVINTAIEEIQTRVMFFDSFPWLLALMPRFAMRWLGIPQISEKLREIFDLMRTHITQHQKTLNPKDPRDYIDAYLIEMEAQKNNPDSTMAVDDLVYCMSDLFSAGSETTSSTIRWAIYYLVKYPEIQVRVQKEIDSVVPRDTLPSVLQKNSLPYLEAFTLEVHRVVSLVRMGVPHCCSKDTEFEGYMIPKGALISANLEGCHRDPTYWERPNDFYPEHFLDSEGKLLSKKEGFMPFALGRRQCLGESLARMELFVFLSALLQNFTFSAPEGGNFELEKDPTLFLLNMPKPKDVLIKKRK